MSKLDVKFKKLHPEAVAPTYAKPGDSGFDLVAVEDVIIEPGETVIVKTGLAFEIPPGYELQVRPRSGVSLKTKLRVVLGTVDSGYRGEVGVIVDNTERVRYVSKPRMMRGVMAGDDDFNITVPVGKSVVVKKGDRIAQGVIAPVITATFTESDELSETERGTGGYGSTGFSKEAAE